jgi:hypothetical protein
LDGSLEHKQDLRTLAKGPMPKGKRLASVTLFLFPQELHTNGVYWVYQLGVWGGVATEARFSHGDPGVSSKA